MFNTLKRAANACAVADGRAILATAAPAFAQAPSQAQRDAIKSQCRSDYMAHCSSVPPGGEASLQCLQKNMSSLSSGCQSAVRAVEAPAAAKAKPADTAAPDAAAPAAATAAPRNPPSRRLQPAHRRRAADQRADFRDPQRLPLRLSEGLRGRADRRRAGAAMPGKEQGKALGRLREGRRRRQRRWRRRGGTAAGAAPAAAGGAAAAPAAPTVIVLRPMRPREELFVLRSACGADVRSICGGVAPGGGRIVQCLATNAASLSPACKDVLSPVRGAIDRADRGDPLHRSASDRRSFAAKCEDQLDQPHRQRDVEIDITIWYATCQLTLASL